MKELYLKGQNGAIEVTEEGVKIYRKSAWAKMIYGFGTVHNEKTINYKLIKGIEFRECTNNITGIGYINLIVEGYINNNTIIGTRINEVTFKQEGNEIAKKIKEEISKRISKDNDLSDLDEIKKLKELLDIGAITQEEYDIKKKELLKL